MKPKLHTVTAGYFPNAIEAIAHHAQYGNDKHNPGEPLHWAFDKSTEHLESAARHLAKADEIDPETGKLHLIGAAMRVLMALETKLVSLGAKPGFAVKRDSYEQLKADEHYNIRTPRRMHPAQHLAVEAFKREQDCPSHDTRWKNRRTL